ncbi:MAG: SpoIIE family protein phosphatase [Salinivirgaceae bacterium]|jgi:serine phosphatase RsbU (regulator of sigma subunit)|nr:SpoIIE family protein phosphatase [Salinivirgaceae bacterium]
MQTDKKQLIKLLETKFENELACEMAEYPVMQFPANMTLGKEGDELEFISVIIQGSLRAVREDSKGEEIKIYDVSKMQSCIITITSAIRNHTSLIKGITNEEVAAIAFPKRKGAEWMNKYESWRNFTIELYEIRLNELLANHEIIKQQKDSILDSIRYAKRIQDAALPPESLIEKSLPDHFVLFKPRDIVSGDYYWMTQIKNKVVVVIADCTGHGIPGAFMSMLGISILNQYINTNSLMAANEILKHLRESIKTSLRQHDYSTDNRDGMDMALMIFDFESKKMEYAGANNPIYIIRNGELIILKPDKMPIGIHIQEKDEFRNQIFDIQKDDCYYAFSDGYVDQIGEKSNRKFMKKSFSELLLKIHKNPMSEQKQILNDTIYISPN